MTTRLRKPSNGKDVFDEIAADPGDPTETGAEPSAEVADHVEVCDLDPGDTGEETATADPSDDDAGDADDAAAPPRGRWWERYRPQTHPEDAPSTPQVGGDAERHPHPARRSWARRLRSGLVAAILLAALAAAGYFGWQVEEQKQVSAASNAARRAAESYAVILTSIDANKVDENFNQVVNGATGGFKDMYSQSAGQLRNVLIDNKAMSKGTVVDSAVKSATKTRVEVLLFIDQWITNSASPEPRMDRSRVAMTMELVDGRWLTSNVELK